MAFNEDLSLFFDTNGFAEQVTVAGVGSVNVIFDNPTDSVDFESTNVEATDASMLVPTSAVTWSRNKLVTRAGGTQYNAVRWSREDDGALTRVFLNKV